MLLLFLLRLAICFKIAGIPADNPVAAREPIAPRTGFAMRSLFSRTYDPIFLNVGTAEALNELPICLKTFDRESIKPLPVTYFFII